MSRGAGRQHTSLELCRSDPGGLRSLLLVTEGTEPNRRVTKSARCVGRGVSLEFCQRMSQHHWGEVSRLLSACLCETEEAASVGGTEHSPGWFSRGRHEAETQPSWGSESNIRKPSLIPHPPPPTVRFALHSQVRGVGEPALRQAVSPAPWNLDPVCTVVMCVVCAQQVQHS